MLRAAQLPGASTAEADAVGDRVTSLYLHTLQVQSASVPQGHAGPKLERRRKSIVPDVAAGSAQGRVPRPANDQCSTSPALLSAWRGAARCVSLAGGLTAVLVVIRYAGAVGRGRRQTSYSYARTSGVYRSRGNCRGDLAPAADETEGGRPVHRTSRSQPTMRAARCTCGLLRVASGERRLED